MTPQKPFSPVIKYVQKNGKNTSEIVKKLGTETFIKETYGVDDAEAWARSHVNELNAAEKAAYELNINAIEEESKYDVFMPYVQILTMTLPK